MIKKLSLEISSDEALEEIENAKRQVEDFDDLNPDLGIDIFNYEVELILLGHAQNELIEKASYLTQYQDVEDLDLLKVALGQIENENKKLEKSIDNLRDKIEAGIEVKENAVDKMTEILYYIKDRVDKITKDSDLPEIMKDLANWKKAVNQVMYVVSLLDKIKASYKAVVYIMEKKNEMATQMQQVILQISDILDRKLEHLQRKLEISRSENDNLRRTLAKMSLHESTSPVIRKIEMYYEEALLLTPPYGFQNRNVGELLREEILGVSEVGEASLANEGAASQVQNDSELQLNEDIGEVVSEENTKDLLNEISKK